MRVGDVVVCGSAHGRVRAMFDTLTGEPIGVAPGTYLAKAWITAAEAANVVVEWETTVE